MTNYSVSANSEVGPLGSEQIPFCFDCGKKWAFKLLSRSCYTGDKAWTDGNDGGDNDDGDVDSGKNLHSMNGANPIRRYTVKPLRRLLCANQETALVT